MSRSIGENYLEEEEHIKVIGVGDVKAGDIILKCGRTTGTTKGKVSQVSVLQWQNGILTSEIAVVAYLSNSNESFARNGDSGALAVRFTATNSVEAVGLVVGNSTTPIWTAITPIRAVTESLSRRFGNVSVELAIR